MSNQVPAPAPATPTASPAPDPKLFARTLWEIRFITNPTTVNIGSKETHLPPITLFVPAEMMPTAQADFLLKLMGVFHSASAKMVEDLLQQAKGLAEFTEADTSKNLEIAKMISWIKMIQEMIEHLRKDLSL